MTALLRGVLVFGVFLVPAILAPGTPGTLVLDTLIFASLAGLWVFVEYAGASAIALDFRQARPVNRLRFVCALGMLTGVSLAMAAPDPSLFSTLLTFPGTPGALLLQVLSETPSAHAQAVAAATALGVASVGVAVLALWGAGWPLRGGAFNVHSNLPLFDPTSGGSACELLRRRARVNLMLACLLPYLLPVGFLVFEVRLATFSIGTAYAAVWAIALWALWPAWCAIRGLALMRVVVLLEAKQRRFRGQAGPEVWRLA